jgi:hypothetical protein
VVAIGATSFTYTPGAATGVANQYAGGWLQVDTTPGNGYTYEVSGHAAIAGLDRVHAEPEGRDSGRAHRQLPRGPDRKRLQERHSVNPTTTATGIVAGVATYIITAAQYGWIQTWGMCSTLINGTPGVGIGVVISATTAGAVDVAAVGAEINVRIIGHMMQVGVSTKLNMVNLKLAPNHASDHVAAFSDDVVPHLSGEGCARC